MGLGDRPANHQLASASGDGFCRTHHAGLITSGCPFRADPRGDQSKRLGVLTAQGRSFKW